MVVEKRRYRRRLISRLVGYDKGDGNINFGMTGNISRGGMLLKSPYPLEVNREVTFYVGLDNDVVSIPGETVECRSRNGLYNIRVAFDYQFPRNV